MEQQRPLLYLMLAFMAFMIWTSWTDRNRPQSIPEQESVLTDQQASDIPQAKNLLSADSSSVPNISTTTAKSIRVKTDVLDIEISLTGGSILEANLLTYPVSLDELDNPIRILDKDKQYAAQFGLLGVNNADAPNHYATFTAEKDEFVLAGDTLSVPLTWQNENGLSVVKTYTFERGKFLIDVKQTLNNLSGDTWTGNQYQQITHGENNSDGGFGLTSVSFVGGAYYNGKYEKVSFGDIQDSNLSERIKGGWAAMLEHYFISAWIPGSDIQNSYYTKYIADKGNHILGFTSPALSVPNGKAGQFKSQFYVGPKTQKNLEVMSPGLDLTVDYGIFSFVSKPIFWVMNKIQSVVSNWGWTIILMTLLLKLLFLYPSAISYKSMAKMKKLAPKIKELNEKHKDNPQAKQKATMDFYRKEKINPLGGCLPILIQMPVFMGLYWVLLESVELRQAPWILWFNDLSVMDPYFILPLLMGISMYIQQRLNPPTVTDPMQQKIFQFLPVVFTIMFLFFPAGLVLYWVVNNILSIAQQYIITKKIMGDSAPVLNKA